MDYPPADRGADRRGQSKPAVSSSISTPAASTISTIQAGDPAMVQLRDDGEVREIQAAFRWVAEHRADLEAA